VTGSDLEEQPAEPDPEAQPPAADPEPQPPAADLEPRPPAPDPEPRPLELAAGADPLPGELRRALGEAVLEVSGGGAGGGAGEDLTLVVRREEIARVAATLKRRFHYTLLIDLCGADQPRRPLRFEVIYHLYSFRENRRLRLKVMTGEGEPVPSLTGVFRGAAWPEREVYDMYGVGFTDHPRLSRLLLWDGFAGHPLRKDFPLAGTTTGAALDRGPIPAETAPAPAGGDTGGLA
jgi:NADH/F420H2 dehydrogenase subunit C